MTHVLVFGSVLDSFGDAISFIFEPQQGPRTVGGSGEVGGLDEVWLKLWPQIWLSALALVIACAIAIPAGVYFGHRGTGELLAVAIGNAGRAIPELILIAFMVAFVGVGATNVTIALVVLGIPPILTNTFVAVRQVDPGAVEAARGVGMSELDVIRRVELPLAVPTLMSGVRTGAITIVSTATIASLAGVSTLGDFIINRGVYGDDGLLAGAILVALLALAFELILAGMQRLLTPRGVQVERRIALVRT